MSEELVHTVRLVYTIGGHEAEFFHDPEGGGYTVEFPRLPGCHTEGGTLEEAQRNAAEALTVYLESVATREREGEIGRMVVAWCHPGDERALREATPVRVIDHLNRMRDELHSLRNSQALRVGRLAIELLRAATAKEPT